MIRHLKSHLLTAALLASLAGPLHARDWQQQAAEDAKQDRTTVAYGGISPNRLVCDTTLREMPDGKWALLMLAGDNFEPSPGNYTGITSSTDEGRTWTPLEVFDTGLPREGKTVGQGPTELMVEQGRCTLFFSTHSQTWGRDWKSWMRHCDDSGKTWSKPEPMPGRLANFTFIRNHIVTRDGRIIVPFQHYMGPGPDVPPPPAEEKPWHQALMHYVSNPRNGVLISSDGGKTWTEHGDIRLTTDDRYHGWAENNIVELADGRIAMIIRGDRLGGVLYYAESKDGGKTWPEFATKTDIPNPGSKATLYSLGGDTVAMLHNPNPKVRSPLALWISFDGLKTWPYQRVLVPESSDGPKGRLNYPDGFVSKDKQWLHFAYDDNRHRAVVYSAKLPDLSSKENAAAKPLSAVMPAGAPKSVDVIVYGATPAGVCAAVGAAREGAKVLLLEPTQHVGGVNTGGLCFSDSNQTVRKALRGLFEEFHQRMEDDYTKRGVKLPYTVAEKDQKSWTYEPHVAAQVTNAMLKEAGVTVRTGVVLDRLVRDGVKIKELIDAKGEFFAAKMFVDATYEGDLMAAAKVNWTLGREGREEFHESLAGKQYPKKPLPISGLDANGKLLPLLTTTDAGPEEAGDRHVMTYSFRLCITAEAGNRVPFPEPKHYDPARFEVVRRYFAQEKKPILLWDLYPLPGGKADANNGIGKQFSMGIIGGGDGWCEANVEGRQRIWEEHKQYTLELYHFLTTDDSVPQALRDELAKYGLCKDEFPATDHWSPQLYVREGRRMRGEYVLTQADIMEHPAKPDPLCIGSFPIDSHDCQRVARGKDEVINEGTIFPTRIPGTRQGRAYQVPYRSVLPKKTECTNLLVPVALSASHVAYCSIRVEPTWMVIGHSSGIAAALCAKENRPAQSLDYEHLKERLLAQKQVLEMPTQP